MYENIGGKIKGLAKASAIIGIIAAIIYGWFLMVTDSDMIIVGLLTMVGGPFGAWISSWVLYGFGELIDKVCNIERNTRGGDIKSKAQLKEDDERINEIEKLRSQGLITEEEYQQAISKDK